MSRSTTPPRRAKAPAGIRTLVSARKSETVRRHSADASSSVRLGGSASASFLFDAAERSSLSAATEAAVQDIASEILQQAASVVTSDAKAAPAATVDPWASSDEEAPALQDAQEATSSRPSLEPELEPMESDARALRLQRALINVQGRASEGKFAEAIEECLPALSGPQEVVDILGNLCAAWQASIKKQKREHQDAMEALVSEVTSAREKDSPDVWRLLEEIEEKETEVSEEVERRAQLQKRLQSMEDELRGAQKDLQVARQRAEQWRRLKDDKERELLAQMRKREDAEREASFLRQSAFLAERTARENSALKKQLQQAEAMSPNPSTLAKSIAEVECNPLRLCHGDARPAVKKKLMMKWHPDKQPTAEHVDFATQVMQALQNQPEWAA